MNNSSNYFTSNTTVVFPPGHHEVSTEGQLVIQSVNNISLVGNNDNSTTIKCVRHFGLAFIKITNLTVSKLSFSMCGAPMSNASWLLKKSIDPFHYPIILQVPSTVSIFLLNITNLTATMLGISHSRGVGLLGGNIFGVSSIQESVFVNNTPNCVIIFLDSYSPVETPVLNITNSSFMFGTENSVGYPNSVNLAAGLSVIAKHSTYDVKSYIGNVTAYGNIGKLHGNMLVRINCKVALQVTRVNSTEGNHCGFEFQEEDSTNCNSFEVASHFYMSNSYFGGNYAGVSLHVSISYSVKLENITVENNSKALSVSLRHSSVLIMKNINITHNMRPLTITSFGGFAMVEFYGSNTFADNACTSTDSVHYSDLYPVLHLKKCNVTFHGNTTFLQNKGRYGGAICAADVEINFQGNTMFLDNEGEYGGALMLYQKVLVVIGQFAEVSFVRNHAQTSGGAVYARDSQIIIRSGQKLSFLENEGYNGGALTLDDDSVLYLEANSSITFASNHAYHHGGAIYYIDEYGEEDFESEAVVSKCF